MTRLAAPFILNRRAFVAGASSLLAARPTLAQASGLTIESYVTPFESMYVSAHLLIGAEEVVLIDTAFLKNDAEVIAEMVVRTARPLSRVIITHAHPDHFMGAAALQKRFPDARFLARPETATEIAAIYGFAVQAMAADYGDAIETTQVTFEPFSDADLRIGDLALPLLDFTGGENHNQLAVLTPDGTELVAADLLYDKTHLYLADGDLAKWRENLDAVEQLGTVRALPGHGQPATTATLIDGTRRYIDVFEREAGMAASPESLTARMKELYPDWSAERLLGYSVAGYFAT